MPPTKNLTKSEIMTALAERADLKKKDVEAVFDALAELIEKQLNTSGEISAIPGLIKIKKVDKKAKPARLGRNPKTGETITIAAKKASKGVKVTMLKTLKDMV